MGNSLFTLPTKLIEHAVAQGFEIQVSNNHADAQDFVTTVGLEKQLWMPVRTVILSSDCYSGPGLFASSLSRSGEGYLRFRLPRTPDEQFSATTYDTALKQHSELALPYAGEWNFSKSAFEINRVNAPHRADIRVELLPVAPKYVMLRR